MIIYDEQAWVYKPRDEKAQGRTDFGMNTVWWQTLCVSLRQQNFIAGRNIFSKKKFSVFDALIKFNFRIRWLS